MHPDRLRWLLVLALLLKACDCTWAWACAGVTLAHVLVPPAYAAARWRAMAHAAARQPTSDARWRTFRK